MWERFKTFATLFSFTVNLILVLGLLVGGIPIKNRVVLPLLGELEGAVEDLDRAVIRATIPIDQQVPVSFTLPIRQQTTVVLQEPVQVQVPTTFQLPGGGGTINGTVFLVLPAGLELPVALEMDVPVQAQIRVAFDQPVAIPLRETELHDVAERLRKLIEPYKRLLEALP